MSEKTPATKKKRLARIRTFARNLKDAYTISKRTYPWVGWAMLGVLVAFLALAVAISVASGQPVWYWILMALLVIASIDLMILSWTVRRASYSQIEGMPGAAKAVLDQLPRGKPALTAVLYADAKSTLALDTQPLAARSAATFIPNLTTQQLGFSSRAAVFRLRDTLYETNCLHCLYGFVTCSG